MFKILIKPQWLIRGDEAEMRQALPRLLELLALLHEDGNLARACRELDMSYRYAWGMIRDGGELFGAPLVETAKGQGTKLTELGQRLLWAEKRINARLAPVLDSLASELEVEIQQTLSRHDTALRIHASHGFAVETLRRFLSERNIPLELKYRGSGEALASLCRDTCEVAAFHVPTGDLQERALGQFMSWLKPNSQRLIHLATRRQGIMVAHGNPLRIIATSDLLKPDVRFVNRQPGSGTRVLLDLLLENERLDGREIQGYDTSEYTHAAVAAYIASGMADAGFGVETAARKFNLDFVPVVTERYFLICNTASLELPAVKEMLGILRNNEFRAAVNELRGYDATECGKMMTLEEAFPEFAAMEKPERRPVKKKGAAAA
ncbi:MAG TPA: substrate-binding domain-containing protein [Burkholderiales bacterium]|nr:substrate-binding domain-containing protein [Burkholderiales bacterium]